MQTGGDADTASRERAELEAIRRRVVNVVGHALRTPITTIAGMANALATASDEDTKAMLVDGLARNAQRVEELLDELLIASGVTTALPVGEPAVTDIGTTVAAVVQTLGGSETVVVDGLDGTVLVRSAVFERILLNLLDNALKYGTGKVTVRGDAIGGRLCIHIESSSEGPTDEELEHAFELLYRGEHAVTRSPGLGIGLPVARELARAEGGDVSVRRHGDVVVATLDLPA